MQENKAYKIFLSAAEHSGDSHCGALINALKQTDYDFEFHGVGGDKMAEAGCELLEKTTEKSAMIYKAFSKVLHFYLLLKKIKNHLSTLKPDLVIVCDSPAFNFHVAKAAKKLNIPVLFYVAPQLWAWAPWRIKKLKKNCDKLCCILPFEQDWFGKHEMDAEFVGNPLVENLDAIIENIKTYENYESRQPIVALMPGSRQGEIDTLWRPMQQIAVKLRRRYPGISFMTVAVDEQKKQYLKANHIINFSSNYETGSVYQTARKVDFTIVASGSATLQVAAAGCPMVIMYQSNKYLWQLVGRWLVTSEFLSLVNILGGKQVVPEFMPYFTSVEPIFNSVDDYLQDKDRLADKSRQLVSLVEPLTQKQASKEVCRIVISMIK